MLECDTDLCSRVEYNTVEKALVSVAVLLLLHHINLCAKQFSGGPTLLCFKEHKTRDQLIHLEQKERKKLNRALRLKNV